MIEEKALPQSGLPGDAELGGASARTADAPRDTEIIPILAEELSITKVAETHDEVLRLAEEQLQVGKQMVEAGRTRVRRFTTERDVAADVTLHEEHAEVLRRAVTDPHFVGELDWSDRAIEIIETAEHALVSKTARVVEEISLKKVGTKHVETVHVKLRRQQAEIERVDPAGRLIQTPRA